MAGEASDIYNPRRSSPSALRYLDTSGYRVLALLSISWGVDKTGRDVRYHFANDKVRTSSGITNVCASICTINLAIHSRLHLGSTDRLPSCIMLYTECLDEKGFWSLKRWDDRIMTISLRTEKFSSSNISSILNRIEVTSQLIRIEKCIKKSITSSYR